jgi:hypothetical protein
MGMVASMTAPRDASVYRSPIQHQPEQREQAQPLPSDQQPVRGDDQEEDRQQQSALPDPEDREADGRDIADGDPDRHDRGSEQHRRHRGTRVRRQVGRPRRRRPDHRDAPPDSHPLPSRGRLPER